MEFMRRIARPIVPVLIALFLNAVMPVHPVSAAMVGTDSVVNATWATGDRERVNLILERADVQRGMQAMGVSASEAMARVAALTDAEVSALADRLDFMPAGADGLGAVVGALVLVFIILLFTDILGLTHVFPAISGKR